MSRESAASDRPGAIGGAARRLLSLLGAAMGAPAPDCPGKRAVLARAIATTPGRSSAPRQWHFVDAILTHNRWLCVLADDKAVYLVEVHPYTGAARLLAQSASRRASGGALTPRGDQAWRGGQGVLLAFCCRNRARRQ